MERVTVPKEIYDTLVYESVLLNCLMVLGVEEWEKFNNALAMSLEEYQENK